MLIQKNWASILLLLVGILVGMSRIYLVQHWFVDTYVGFLFGVLSCLVAFWILQRFPRKWHQKRLEFPFLKKSE